MLEGESDVDFMVSSESTEGDEGVCWYDREDREERQSLVACRGRWWCDDLGLIFYTGLAVKEKGGGDDFAGGF